MPLLKKKPFQKAPLPSDLRKEEEIFHCVITNEIFRDYEEYCQRVILCNSMVWTCSMTGKSGLTYMEALESEQNAQQQIKDFPTELRIPVLFLATKTQRTSFLDMAEDIFIYMKDRYFIGENVEASFSGYKWRESHVLQVIPPSEDVLKKVQKNGQSTERHFFPPAHLYRYEVEQLDAEEEDVSEVMVVDYDHIKRRKTTFTREKCKLFLKQFAETNSHGVIVIKESVLEDYSVPKIKFDQIFDGPLPNFEVSRKRIKSLVNGKKTRQETLAQYLSKNEIVSSEKTIDLLDNMRKRQEEYKQMKETLKQKKADEKLAEKQRRKEENIQISQILKDWYKPKEDLLLDDHKKLPVPAPVKTKVPDKYMGDVLAVIEFVQTFSKVLHFKDFFPDGLTIEFLERALSQHEVAGPLMDIVQMFLSALFNVQNEEASQYSTVLDNHTDIKEKDVNDNISLTEATHFATVASNWSTSHQGMPLNKLPLYSLTTSEILRLHLLSSGARINETGAKWRYHNRGGYTSEDDPGLYLRLKYPHILKELALYNFTELPVGDKLQVLHCLMNQLLTYADVRDVVEDRLEKSRQARVDLRSLQAAERRREQEYITGKLKIKREGKENKKDVTNDLEKLDREAEKKKGQYEKKIEGLIKQSTEFLVFLGQDRAFRKYFKLESIPGIFVNFEEEHPGYCFDECIRQNSDLVGADRSQTLAHVRKIYEERNVNKENGEPEKINEIRKSMSGTEAQSLLVCDTSPTTCVVHSSTVDRQRWAFYHSREQLEELINSLNTRGVREGDLKQAIINEQDHIMLLANSAPISSLNPDVEFSEVDRPRPKRLTGRPKYEDTNLGYPIEMNTASVLQFSLVDNILELEEKIFAGNLGCLKVKDRKAWRDHLTQRHFDLMDTTLIKRENFGVDKVKKENKNSRPNTPDLKEYKDPGKFLGSTVEVESQHSDIDNDELPLYLSEDHSLAIKTLANCLIQVAQGVESRYLKKPLGHASTRSDNKKDEHDVLERWEHSLAAATSYSQIFLHFGTLDNCIMWSRSALLARCTICRRQTDSENMLLCDNCNKGHHLYCLKPKLTSVPKGDWFCKECQKQKDKEAKLQNPELKPEPRKRRRLFKEVSDDETSEQSSEQSEPRRKRKTKEEDASESESSSPTEDIEEEEQEMEEEEETQSEEQEENGMLIVEVCIKCGSGGTLLCCDKCPDMYHLECVEPPLRRVPRGEWFCTRCKTRKKRERSDYSVYSRAVQRSGHLQNQRRCAARARHKIYGFAKTLRRISESEDSDSNSDEVTSTRRSGRREIESRDDLPLHNATLQELLSDMLKQDDAWPFVRPVLKTEVPDYYDIITKPIDFGTIKYKLNIGEYQCDAEVMSDAALVFENCNTYNNSKDEVYKCGARLLKHFVNKARHLGLLLPKIFKELQDEIADDNDNDASEMHTP